MAQDHGRLAVLGLGYVGLPLAMRAVDVGFDVVGFDVDKARVDTLQRGSTFIDGPSSGQPSIIQLSWLTRTGAAKLRPPSRDRVNAMSRKLPG